MGIPAIDMHGHFGRYAAPDRPLCEAWWSRSVDEVKGRARAAGVRLTVVSPLKSMMPEGGGDPLGGNEDAVAAVGNDPELLFWAVLHPGVRESFEQARELLGHARCAGIKIHPTCHRYEIREHGEPIFQFAAEESALVLTHSGCPGAFPEDYVVFMNRYPAARLILAHLGHDEAGSYDRQVTALQQCQAANVWVDTSSAMSMYAGLIEWAVREVGAERLVFGTDTPLYAVASQKARIEFAEIPEADKRKILWENAAAFLGDRSPDE